jgi:CubicO group peptidase (beta-lactamase class C family)
MKYLIFFCILTAFILTLPAAAVSAINSQDTSLDAFFDNTMNSKLEKYHIPNATVSVVKDGGIVYKKGFGLADIVNNIQSIPILTSFVLVPLQN